MAWSHVLNKYGTPNLKKRVLPDVASGKSFLGIATTEAGIGADLANMTTIAKRVGDEYVLNGEKMYISGIRETEKQMPEGSGYLVLAKTDSDKGARGLSFFWVPFNNVPGLTPSYLEEMGRRGMSSGGFLMKDVRVPKENLLGEENKGFYQAMEGFDYARHHFRCLLWRCDGRIRGRNGLH